MLIANPIYDLAFKYLMENLDIAKGIISAIMDEEIIHIDFQAKESTIKLPSKFTFYHLDYIARIRDKQGKSKDVLIELRKTNVSFTNILQNALKKTKFHRLVSYMAHEQTLLGCGRRPPFDIVRFRHYLGSQYRKEEEVIQPDGSTAKESLPIVTIYFLGFFLSKTLPAVIKVDRQYIDVLSGTSIKERHNFIECLTHDSYVIQIPGLKLEMKSQLEYVLSIFKQERLLKGDNRLKDYVYEIKDELMQKIVNQLAKAAADNDLLEQMEMEELAQHEYETTFAPLERKLQKHEKTIEEHEKTIEENKKAIQEKDKTIEEKDKYIRELTKKLEGKT